MLGAFAGFVGSFLAIVYVAMLVGLLLCVGSILYVFWQALMAYPNTPYWAGYAGVAKLAVLGLAIGVFASAILRVASFRF
jgi:hypothetical protein